MANRADLLIQSMFGNRWTATSNPAAGATCVATSPTTQAMQSAKARPHIETLIYAIHNKGVSTGVPFTVAVQLSHASPTGTLIASINHFVASSTAVQVSTTCLAIPGKRGVPICASMNTVIASLTQSVSIAGWIEDNAG